MSEFKELKAEYVLLAGKNPPPMSADALRAKVAALKAAAEQEPPAQDPPAQDPPVQDPPAEDPPAQDPPAQDPPAEDPPAQDPPAQEPPAQDDAAEAGEPSIEEQLVELGLTADANGDVALHMLTGLSGPDICLVNGDPHSCNAREAVNLVRAGFAKPR